jgi:hypothetical protein
MFGLFKKVTVGRKPAREFLRACNVYCQPEDDRVIVTALYNHGGLMAEMPGGATIAMFSDTAKLHEAVRAALEACKYEEDFNYSDQKKSDWPAYQASGYKTIKRFEAEFTRLFIKGVNEQNFFYELTSPEFGELGLHLTVTVNACGGNFGEAIHYILKKYLACKAVVNS